jgi:hypothetical protein
MVAYHSRRRAAGVPIFNQLQKSTIYIGSGQEPHFQENISLALMNFHLEIRQMWYFPGLLFSCHL